MGLGFNGTVEKINDENKLGLWLDFQEENTIRAGFMQVEKYNFFIYLISAVA
jgi:hypothetical protein